jgi:hypothetical protein
MYLTEISNNIYKENKRVTVKGNKLSLDLSHLNDDGRYKSEIVKKK